MESYKRLLNYLQLYLKPLPLDQTSNVSTTGFVASIATYFSQNYSMKLYLNSFSIYSVSPSHLLRYFLNLFFFLFLKFWKRVTLFGSSTIVTIRKAFYHSQTIPFETPSRWLLYVSSSLHCYLFDAF